MLVCFRVANAPNRVLMPESDVGDVGDFGDVGAEPKSSQLRVLGGLGWLPCATSAEICGPKSSAERGMTPDGKSLRQLGSTEMVMGIAQEWEMRSRVFLSFTICTSDTSLRRCGWWRG